MNVMVDGFDGWGDQALSDDKGGEAGGEGSQKTGINESALMLFEGEGHAKQSQDRIACLLRGELWMGGLDDIGEAFYIGFRV
jgi:hypothetical protein